MVKIEHARHESRSAVFLSAGEHYHADNCGPLRAAVRRGEVHLAALARRGYPGHALAPDVLPEISTIGFWDARGAQQWGLDWHRNEGIELTYLARGQTAFLVDHDRFHLESGALTITRPWQRHRVGDPHVGPSRLCWLILDVGVRRPNQRWLWPDWLLLSPTVLAQLTTLLSHNEHCVWKANRAIAEGFQRISECVQKPRLADTPSRLKLHINELFLAVFDLLRLKEMPLDSRLVSTKRTVELFLANLPHRLDHPWTLAEMAENCGLGRTRFADYCRQIVNMTPAEYLSHSRIEAAKRRLESEPGASVTDVGLASGFQSSQYFATAFRERTGLSPSAFRTGLKRQPG